jgi:RHS repeat-associated protein
LQPDGSLSVATVSYGYDQIDRLTSEKRTGSYAYWYEYSYDGSGNRLGMVERDGTGNIVGQKSYSYDSGNKLLQEVANGVTTVYQYDPNGNTISKATGTSQVRYYWDDEDKMVRVEDSVVMNFKVDGLGFRRFKEVVGQYQRWFVYDLAASETPGLVPLLAEYDENGNLVAKYHYDGGGLIAMTRNNQSYWYGFEGIGTVRQLMGSQGQVVDAYAYDAWGNEITNPQSQVPNPFKYVGKHGYYLDTESALMLLGVRYYASGIGRFVSLDPIKHKMNWYTYVTDNPLSNIDPTGKNPWGLIVCTASCGLTLLGPIGGCIAGGLVNPADVICCALEAIKESGTSGVIGGVISVGCLACILWVLLRGPIKKYPEIPVCLIGALAGGFTGAMSSGDCSSVVCSAIAGCVFGTGGVVIKGKPEIVLEERAQLLLLPFVHVLEHLFTLICMVADILKTFVNVYSEDHGVFPVFETGALGTLFRLLGREV